MVFYGCRVQMTAETGKCCKVLYAIGKVIGACMHSDTEDVEGFNSIIKSECKRCPHLSHELLNARCRLRAELGVAGSGISHKWSKIRGRLREVLDSAIEGSQTQHYQSMLNDVSESARFAPPQPAHS